MIGATPLKLSFAGIFVQIFRSIQVIRKIVIQQSIAGYSRSCPCPYNRDRGGRSCGRRSAYSRPGGASPLCFDQDVTEQMINEYRKRHQ